MLAQYKKAVAALLSWRNPVSKNVSSSANSFLNSDLFSNNGEGTARLNAIISNTYTEVLIYLRTNKGVTGDSAKLIAFEFVAKSVRKSTGRNIDAEYVRRVVSN